MNQLSLIVIDRGGGLFLVVALALLVASLLSLPLMPIFHYSQSERMRHFGGQVYGFLAIVTMMTGLALIPASLFVVIAACVVRYKGTGIPQSLFAFAVGGAIWLSTPLIFIFLGRFHVWFSRRLAPDLWDKKLRTAERRRKAALRRTKQSSSLP